MCVAGWIEIRQGSDQRSHLVVVTTAEQAKRTRTHSLWLVAQGLLRQLVGHNELGSLHSDFDRALRLLGPYPNG